MDGGGFDGYKNTVDNLSKSKVILMCGPAGSGKSTLAKKFESTGMTILSYDEESFKRGLKEHPLPQEVLEDIKTYLDEKLISLIMQNIDIVLDYSFWSREMRNQCMTGYLLGCVFRITCSIELVAHR